MEVWSIIFLSKWVICMFHVNLPECIGKKNPVPWSIWDLHIKFIQPTRLSVFEVPDLYATLYNGMVWWKDRAKFVKLLLLVSQVVNQWISQFVS